MEFIFIEASFGVLNSSAFGGNKKCRQIIIGNTIEFLYEPKNRKAIMRGS